MSRKVARYDRADTVQVGDYVRTDWGDLSDVVEVEHHGDLVRIHLVEPGNVYTYEASETLRIVGDPRPIENGLPLEEGEDYLLGPA